MEQIVCTARTHVMPIDQRPCRMYNAFLFIAGCSILFIESTTGVQQCACSELGATTHQQFFNTHLKSINLFKWKQKRPTTVTTTTTTSTTTQFSINRRYDYLLFTIRSSVSRSSARPCALQCVSCVCVCVCKMQNGFFADVMK